MIEKASISFRIAPAQWMPEARYAGLLELLGKYQGVTDELTFFLAHTHAPMTIDAASEQSALLADRMAQARARGYGAGINILATIGHHEEDLSHSLSGDYTRLTDIDGNVCAGSFCPRDDNLRDYIRGLYELTCSAEPDYIWIDDDVRLVGHMPITCGCFCDRCLAVFKSECGTAHTRESLKRAFTTGSVQDKVTVRKAWLQHNRDMIADLFALIEQTVHSARPGLPLGFMTGDRLYEGYDFDNWARILSGPDKAEVLWRPGGGFYKDERLPDLTGKSHDIGRQVSLLPDNITRIQSEIENFPYQVLKKSVHTTALEAASHIASGCTGAAFNILSALDEPLTEYEPFLSKLHRTRPFYDLMAATFGRSQPVGIHTGWGTDSFAAHNIDGPDWFAGDPFEFAAAHASELFEIGLPPAYSPHSAPVTALSGDSVLALTDEQIRGVLSAGVYMDASALDRLNNLGYAELTGFTTERLFNDDCIEQLLDHPLNSSFVGRLRDCRQSFKWWFHPAAALKPENPASRALTRLIDYADGDVAPCTMGVFENSLGGRICVAGYYPWTYLQSGPKSSQIKAVMRWLSKDTLPAYVASLHKVSLWARDTAHDGIALAVTNASLDPADNLVLMLRTQSEQITVFDMDCSQTHINACDTDTPYKKFVLPAIGAWEMRLVTAGPGRST